MNDFLLDGKLRAYILENYRHASLREIIFNLRSYDLLPRDDGECAEQLHMAINYFLVQKRRRAQRDAQRRLGEAGRKP